MQTAVFLPQNTSMELLVIGGGFAGSAVSIQALKQGLSASRITIVEPRPELGRGIAYSSADEHHALNVPAGRMSLFADEPNHFLSWLEKNGITAAAADFVSRRIFGAYVCSILDHYLAMGRSNATTLVRLQASVNSIERGSDGIVAKLNNGDIVQADRVIVATGNALPANPWLAAATEMTSIEGYVSDPWSKEAVIPPADDGDLIFIGTGLTMADLVLSYERSGFRGRIRALSRHGLLPLGHRPASASHAGHAWKESPVTALGMLTAVRRNIEEAARNGIDWRVVLDSLRPHTQSIWRAFSDREKARFLRHLRTYWDIHRHRVPPQNEAALKRMLDSGQLSVVDVAVSSVERHKQQLVVSGVRRSTREKVVYRASKVVNCTGTSYDCSRTRNPLISNLIKSGLATPNKLGLGLRCDERGALLDAQGKVSDSIFAIGGLRIGELWETTAVPELRVQAEQLARIMIAK